MSTRDKEPENWLTPNYRILPSRFLWSRAGSLFTCFLEPGQFRVVLHIAYSFILQLIVKVENPDPENLQYFVTFALQLPLKNHVTQHPL